METSLSCGKIIKKMLKDALGNKVSDVFMLYKQDARLPYVAYRLADDDTKPTKSASSSDTAAIEVAVFADNAKQMVSLSEDIRAALDHKHATLDGLKMKACTFVRATDKWEDGTYYRTMQFICKF